MPETNPRIDAYIGQAQPFARPVLRQLRRLVHEACPEVQETMKWRFPHFEHKGILCSMAAFKQHCVFGFWKARLLQDPQGVLVPAADERNAMGSVGRITGLGDLPPDAVILDLIRQAAALNESGVRLPDMVRKPGRSATAAPDYLTAALQAHPQAQRHWDRFPPSEQKEYITWLTEVRTAATREKRLAVTLAQLAEGKRRNWKYEQEKKR